MCLQDANLPCWVDSAVHHYDKELEIPALKESCRHDRISGFWDMVWFKRCHEGLEIFSQQATIHGGKLRLIVGIPINDSTPELVRIHEEMRSSEKFHEKFRNLFLEMLEGSLAFSDSEARDIVSTLLEGGVLKLRILPEVGAPGSAPEHSKMQLFYDECADPSPCWALASGSKNDTFRGNSGGADTSPVNASWRGSPEKMLAGAEASFKRKWDNATQIGHEMFLEVLKKAERVAKGENLTPGEEVKRKLILGLESASRIAVVPRSIADAIQERADQARLSKSELFIHPSNDPPLEFIADCMRVCSGIHWHPKVAVVSPSFTSQSAIKGAWFGAEVSLWCNLEQYSDGGSLEDEEIWKSLVENLGIILPPEGEEEDVFRYVWSSDGPAEHQQKGISLWEQKGHSATLEHATGSYKTASGLWCASKMFEDGCELVVITAPKRDVARQWVIQARRSFNQKRIVIVPCWSDHGTTKVWGARLDRSMDSHKSVLAIFCDPSLWKLDDGLLDDGVAGWGLVADEVHNWVTDKRARRFMEHEHLPTHRLSLSAQVADDESVQEAMPVLEWFGGVDAVHPFTLEDAIDLGYLRKYDYILHGVKLGGLEKGEEAEKAFDRRKREITPETVSLAMEEFAPAPTRVLVYTGERIRVAEDLCDKIQANMGVGITWRTEKFTSEESRDERKRILNDFRKGLTRVLVAIKCLDEGVDLPVSDVAVMCLSNEDSRQWIQRRGRILRPHPLEPKRHAIVHDFILNLKDIEEEHRKMLSQTGYLKKELIRVERFVNASRPDSRTEAILKLKELGWNVVG
jgi:superfamily II DNA or RNA helicase